MARTIPVLEGILGPEKLFTTAPLRQDPGPYDTCAINRGGNVRGHLKLVVHQGNQAEVALFEAQGAAEEHPFRLELHRYELHRADAPESWLGGGGVDNIHAFAGGNGFTVEEGRHLPYVACAQTFVPAG